MSDFSNDNAAANTAPSSESVSTSASPETAAPSADAQPLTLERETPFDREDGWANFGKKDVSDAAPKENETTETDETDTPAPKSDEEPKSEEKAEPEQPAKEQDESAVEEDEVLADLFGEEKKTENEEEARLTDEMIKALRPAAQAAAKRNERKAELVKDFQYADKPITEVMSRLEELSPQRFNELRQTAAQDLLDADPEGFFRRAYTVKMYESNPDFDYRTAEIPTLTDIISGSFNQVKTEVNQADDLLLERFGFDYRDPENDQFLSPDDLAMVQHIRALEADKAALIKTGEGQSEEFKALQKQIESVAQERQEKAQVEFQTTMQTVVNDFRTSLESKLIPHIAKNTGLEVKPDDSPSIRSFKERKLELYTGTDYEKANNQSSQFENFAYFASSVKDEFMQIFDRLAPLHEQEARARIAGNTAELQKARELISETRIPLFTLYNKANEEFKPRFITPDMELLSSLGTTISQNINTAKQRIEVVSSGAQTRSEPAVVEYETADDRWDGMVARAQRNQQLRTGA